MQFCSLHVVGSTGESLGRTKMLRQLKGKVSRHTSVGVEGWFPHVPTEQVEQPLSAWIQNGGLGLVFLCQ